MLTPYCPPEFVRKVITGLTEQCNMTGDYSFLDKELSNVIEGMQKGMLCDTNISLHCLLIELRDRNGCSDT